MQGSYRPRDRSVGLSVFVEVSPPGRPRHSHLLQTRVRLRQTEKLEKMATHIPELLKA